MKTDKKGGDKGKGKGKGAAPEAEKKDDGPGSPLLMADILAAAAKGEASEELILNGRQASDVDSLERFRGLTKLELRRNALTRLRFVEANHALCWLALAGNRLTKLDHLQKLTSLAVLDISDNKISSLKGLAGLKGLKALLAARNPISEVKELTPERHPLLETVVFSHNEIAEFAFKGFGALKKISLAHNALTSFPQLEDLPALAELRLNGNKITEVSECVTELPSLSILDVGKNEIASLEDVAALKRMPALKNLNVYANPFDPVLSKPSPELLAFVKELPKVEVLNTKRLDGQPGKKRQQLEQAKAEERPAGAPAAKAAPSGEKKAKKKETKKGKRAAAAKAVAASPAPAAPAAAAPAPAGKKLKRKAKAAAASDEAAPSRAEGRRKAEAAAPEGGPKKKLKKKRVSS